MTTLLALLACTPATDALPSASDTSTDLTVAAAPHAPSVLLVQGDTDDWSIEVDGKVFEPDEGGAAAVWGLAQGTTHEATVTRGGEQSPLSLEMPPHPRPWSVDVFDPDRSEVLQGVLLTGIVARADYLSEVVAIRPDDGEPVWWHPVDVDWDLSGTFPSAKGGGFVWLENDDDRDTNAARMVALSLDGRTYEVLDTPDAHHVGLEVEPGRYAMIMHEVLEDVPVDDGETYDPASDMIVEMNADGTGSVVVLSMMQDWFQGSNQWFCEHSRRRGQAFGYDALNEWTHGNSLRYLPTSDSYLVYLRWIDALVKVGRDGTVHWHMGGPWSDYTSPGGQPVWTGQDDSPLWSHGHFSDAWEGGVLMYDNGNHSGAARVVQVEWDEQDLTVDVVASWPAPDGAVHEVLGDARRLPGGNVLINWTVLGLIQELTPGGDVVWQMHGEPELWFSRMRFAPDLESLAQQ